MTIQQVTLRSQLLHRVALQNSFNRVAYLGNVWKLFPQPNVYLWVSVPDRFRPSPPLFKYHGETTFFRCPNEEDLDPANVDFQVSAFEDKRFGESFETQVMGSIRGFFLGGDFIYKTGLLQEKSSPTSLIVSTSGLEALVDSVAIGGLVREQGWSGLDPVQTNFLWACTVEESDLQGSFLSSRMKSQWDPVSTTSATPPAERECALIATFLSGVGIDENPPGKATLLSSLSQHVLDNTDPHGQKLFQEFLQATDVDVLESVLLDEFLQSGVILDVLRRGRYGRREILPGTVLGDLDLDGSFGQSDADELANILSGVTPAPPATSQAFINGDVNADGRLDSVDLQFMLDRLAGRIDQFPPEDPGTFTRHVLVSGLMNVIGKFIYHGDLTLSGSNFTDQDALLGAIDNIKAVTVGALTINSGLEVAAPSTFHEDITILSGFLWDGLSISGHGATLDAHLLDFDNPHQVLSGQVPDAITELGGVLSGDLSVLSGLAIGGVDWSELLQFVDGSEIQERTHLHFTTSGLQFFGFAPESTVFDTVFGPEAAIRHEHRDNKNVGVLSGQESVVTAHVRKFLPEDFGTAIRATYTHGVESNTSGLDLLFGGSFGDADLDNTVPSLVIATNFNQLGGDLGTGIRFNDILNGTPAEWEEHNTNIPAVPAIVLSGADFETSASPSPGLRPRAAPKQVLEGASIVCASAWYTPESSFADLVLMGEASSAGVFSPRFMVQMGGSFNQIFIFLRRTSGSVTVSSPSDVYTDGVNNHIVVVCDLTLDQFEIYVNDVLEDSGTIPGSGNLETGTPSVPDSEGFWWGARAPSSVGGNPISALDGVLDIGLVWKDFRINSTHVTKLFAAGAGIEFQGKKQGSITMQLRDSNGNIINPVGAVKLRESALTETTVNISGGDFRGNSFMELQYVLSGAVEDALFFGPWSLLYAPSNIP